MPGKIVIASQHYPPDSTTTAGIVAEIAGHLAADAEVLVLSGTPGSATSGVVDAGRPAVAEVKNRIPEKGALVRRATSEALFTLRIFLALVRRLRRGDVVVTVTAPFMLPYASVAAARCKGARSVLILHDLFPDVLVMSGLFKPRSLVARTLRTINTMMFRTLDIIVTIGRDTERLLLRYRGVEPDKIRFIPNWATLAPSVRPIEPENPFRRAAKARFVVGLSGNLGFTHDPKVVFEAARLLRDEADIHFLLSGWGVGFETLKALQAEASLPNVSLVERVVEEQLEQLLAAADIWVIPYRPNAAGVSVPSRFYNLLAIGRPVILISEPEAEAALIVTENQLGWVVDPGRPEALAEAVRVAARTEMAPIAARAVTASANFTLERAMASYRAVARELLQRSQGKPS